MAKALPTGSARRPLFGALDPDGWTWAGLKAGFWFIAIILLIGYIPDRAYYFTVNRTIDVGVMLWSPVNLCPAENRGLPCPVPAGAIVPWDLSPNELALPEGRADGAAAQLGKYLLYVGGDNGSATTTTTFVATLDKGSFGAWATGPALPAARSGAGLVILNGAAYLVGGAGPDGTAVATVWSLSIDAASGALGQWTPVEGLALPAARTGASVLAVADGILVAGGAGPDGAPTATVWKSTAAKDGKLGAFTDQPKLPQAVKHASVALAGGYVWLYGGSDANGASGAVQRATYGAPPAASGTVAVEGVQAWAISDAANLPAARTGAAGFAANGTLYLVGGSDGTSPRAEVYWTVPSAKGDISGWHRETVTDLAAGLAGASAVVSGSQVFVIGGKTDTGIIAASLRSNLAPQGPFFQLGLLGATVPALQLPGEVGQQLGYLAAAGAGTADFVLLLIIGWGFNHRPQVRSWIDRRRARRAGRAA